jgi:DNA-binding response OmpR family regulator
MNEKILIIDDNKDVWDLYLALLKREGYTDIKCAADGFTGLEIARKWKPDLILLDIAHPGPNGIEICKTLSSESETQKTKFIIIAGYPIKDYIVEALRFKVSAYIEKPFDPREFMKTVKAVLESDKN